MTFNAPTVHNTIHSLRAALDEEQGSVVLVPTMGALHEGHLSLVRKAQEIPGAVVVVSIFVNPLQFAPGEDLDAYPRTLDRDVELLAEVGADHVFAPNAKEMYPAGPRTVIHPGSLGSVLEGATRPTHFAGVLTVVNKLFHISRCTHAVFGEKDYQQLLVIKQMVEDGNLDVEIIPAPIVREDSGLARSSRNSYLSAEEAQLATALSRALRAGTEQDTPEAVLTASGEVLAEHPEIELDYLELRSADLGEPVLGENRLLVAARVGTTRLIDNCAVHLSAL